MNDVIVLLIRMLAGAEFPGYPYFLGSFVGGALWPVLSVALKLPQRPRSDPDHV
jgi:rod shape-determining protein MreD